MAKDIDKIVDDFTNLTEEELNGLDRDAVNKIMESGFSKSMHQAQFKMNVIALMQATPISMPPIIKELRSIIEAFEEHKSKGGCEHCNENEEEHEHTHTEAGEAEAGEAEAGEAEAGEESSTVQPEPKKPEPMPDFSHLPKDERLLNEYIHEMTQMSEKLDGSEKTYKKFVNLVKKSKLDKPIVNMLRDKLESSTEEEFLEAINGFVRWRMTK